MDTKLKKYIQKELKKGFSKKEIKETLLASGYDEHMVDDALLEVEGAGVVSDGHEGVSGKSEKDAGDRKERKEKTSPFTPKDSLPSGLMDHGLDSSSFGESKRHSSGGFILSIIGIFVVIGVAGFFLFPFSGSGETVSGGELVEEAEEVFVPALSLEEVTGLVEEKVTTCHIERKNYYCLARATGDATYCDQVDEEDRIHCKAEIMGTEEGCDLLEGPSKDHCYARVTGDITYCDSIEEPFKSWCLAYAQQDAAACTTLQEVSDPDNYNCCRCLFEDPSFCQEIVDYGHKALCVATEKKTVEGCNELASSTCEVGSHISVGLTHDYDTCAFLEGASKDRCQYEKDVALLNDMSGHTQELDCAALIDSKVKEACTVMQAGDLSSCSLLSTAILQLNCVTGVAEMKNDPSLCLNLDGWLLEECQAYFLSYNS